jgi:hypothetical protein
VRRIALLAACCLPLVGCLSMDETPEDSRDIPTTAFVKGSVPQGVRPSVVEIPASEFQPDPDETQDTTVQVDASGNATTSVTRTVRAPGSAAGSDGTKTPDASITNSIWPVDSLIGQVNGKPLYANEFLIPREDRLRRIATGSPSSPDKSYEEFRRIIYEAFDQFVNNELVISEAESTIPDEAKEGLLAWMRELQEKEIASRGGTRSEAERSIEEEFPGMTIEDFTKRQKNEALANDLMRRRVRPRAIVSWRDIERLYMRNYEVYNPPPMLRVGRIAVPKADQAKVDQVKALFAEGKTFEQVATAMSVPNDGLWREFKLGAQGVDGIPDIVEDLKVRIKGLKQGVVDGPVEQRAQVSWMTLFESKQAAARSIFDPRLQLLLRRQLEGERFAIEQNRYLNALRTRWIAEDLLKMRERLVDFALDRYWPGRRPSASNAAGM